MGSSAIRARFDCKLSTNNVTSGPTDRTGDRPADLAAALGPLARFAGDPPRTLGRVALTWRAGLIEHATVYPFLLGAELEAALAALAELPVAQSLRGLIFLGAREPDAAV